MSERDEALRRFPPANPQKLVPMTIPETDIRKDYDEVAKVSYEKLAYEVLESPEFWFNLDRIKVLTGLTYWPEVRKVVDVLSDKNFIAKAKKFYESFRYPYKTSKIALANIKDVEEIIGLGGNAVPQTVRGVKAPWEMTREEFYKPVELPLHWGQKGYTAIRQPGGGIKKIITPDGEELFPLDHWGIDWGRSTNPFLHEAIVRQALQRGLAVPAEVLADYPHPKEGHGPEVAPHLPLYSSPARKIKDELERLKHDPERPRFVKEIKDEIKQRERGKIKKFTDVSLTELREIIKEESLYR